MTSFDPKQTAVFLWSNVYIPLDAESQITAALGAVHEEAGYQPYNPFPGGGGTPVGNHQLIRLFQAPAKDGWTRLIGQSSMDLLPALAQKLHTPLFYGWISDTDCGFLMFGGSEIEAYLRPDTTRDDFWQAYKALKVPTAELLPDSTAPKTETIPDELAKFAAKQGVDIGDANKLIQKTVQQLFQKNGSDGALQSAMALLGQQQGASAIWQGDPARRLGAVIACLTIPAEDWRTPDFRDLAAAYNVACLLDQNPKMRLLPGDEDLLDKIEYPLDYHPIYYARPL